MTFRIGVDIGGTFTDFAMYDEDTGRITLGKTPTTSDCPDVGCLSAIRLFGGPLEDCSHFLHGTTVGLNALLERSGAKVGLLCTEGFRDTLELRRGSRPPNSPIEWVPPAPLVPRHLRRSVGGRLDRSGREITPVDRDTVADALRMFQGKGVDAIAVCLMNSYVNPDHELQVARLLRESGFEGYVSLSHSLSREYREYERTSTTVVDAFVQARMVGYLSRVLASLRDDGFQGQSRVMRSGGGAMSFAEAQHRAFETINSGPVAGALGAAEMSRTFGLGDLITADVGGTSFDTCLIQGGRPNVLFQGEVAGQPIQSSWVDVRSIGAGGGSIAYVDSAGLMHVGPRSSGSQPGPACYGRGGQEATTTDAAFLLGMLGRTTLASGVRLDRDAAETAVRRLAAPLGLSIERTAAGIIRIASAAMANAIREITIEEGIDPRALKLLAIGGAGPMLANQIARELSIDTVLVPPFAGNFSAWGLLGADATRESAQTVNTLLRRTTSEALRSMVDPMLDQLSARAADQGSASTQFEVAFDLRFEGQEHGLSVAAERRDDGELEPLESLRAKFRDQYLAKFGILPEGDLYLTTIRALMREPLPSRKLVQRPAPEATPGGREIQVYSFHEGRTVEGQVHERANLPVGVVFNGPAVIIEETTTIYVDVDYSFEVDSNDFLTIRKEQQRG